MKLLIKAFIALISLAAAANAETPNTPVLMDDSLLGPTCENKELEILCAQYIVGVQDTLSFMRSVGFMKPDQMAYCFPAKTTGAELVTAVRRYYLEDPRRVTQGKGVMSPLTVASALAEAFPCKK